MRKVNLVHNLSDVNKMGLLSTVAENECHISKQTVNILCFLNKPDMDIEGSEYDMFLHKWFSKVQSINWHLLYGALCLLWGWSVCSVSQFCPLSGEMITSWNRTQSGSGGDWCRSTFCSSAPSSSEQEVLFGWRHWGIRPRKVKAVHTTWLHFQV